LRIWNVKYFILAAGAPDPDPAALELAYDGEVRLYRYREFLPRAWLAPEASVLPETGVYRRLADPGFDPRRTVLFEAEPSCHAETPAGPEVGAEQPLEALVLDRRAERVALETRSPRFAYLVLSESFDPGWKARVDGREVPILRANLNFRAVPLGPGRHRVEMTYAPASYRWGWIACGLSLGGLLGVLGAARRATSADRLAGIAVLAVLVPAAALAASRREGARSRPGDCGQLRVAERLLDRNGAVSRAGAPAMPAARAAVPSRLQWPLHIRDRGLVRVRAALAEGDPSLVRMLLRRPAQADLLLTQGRVERGSGWELLEAPLPEGGGVLSLEAAAAEGGASAGAVLWGDPIVFTYGPREPSILSLSGAGRPEALDAASHRFRVIVAAGEVAGAGFDEIYESRGRDDLAREAVDRIPDAYRISTDWIVASESDEQGRQLVNLLRRRLRGLGLRPDDLEVPRPY
jgi:hypothetical protein